MLQNTSGENSKESYRNKGIEGDFFRRGVVLSSWSRNRNVVVLVHWFVSLLIKKSDRRHCRFPVLLSLDLQPWLVFVRLVNAGKLQLLVINQSLVLR